MIPFYLHTTLSRMWCGWQEGWKHQVSDSFVSNCSSSVGTSVTLLCLRDQAEEWQRLSVTERPIVASQSPKLDVILVI